MLTQTTTWLVSLAIYVALQVLYYLLSSRLYRIVYFQVNFEVIVKNVTYSLER